MSRWDQRTEGPPRTRREPAAPAVRSRSRSRSRSLSPVERRLRQLDEERQRKEAQLRKAAESQRKYDHRRSSSSSSGSSSDGSDNEGPVVPPAPQTITKVGFSFQKPPPSAKPASTGFQLQQQQKPSAIQLKLAAGPKKEPPKLLKPTANAFADDSDDEPEEMPAECRMRMRNIGRETPTSSGPNSFGKTKHGFCDSKKMLEKKLNSSLQNS
uniref:PEST proteolytic signal-containing nuclear protein n=1 Tax=Culex tarsalis TaxID=7177 RepID=A0A1Q3F8E3_CULTA